MDCNCSSPIGMVHCLNVAFPPSALSCWDLVPENWLSECMSQCESDGNYLRGTQINFLIGEIYFGVRTLMNLTMKWLCEPYYKMSFVIQFVLPSFLSFCRGESAVFFFLISYFIQDKEVERNSLLQLAHLPTWRNFFKYMPYWVHTLFNNTWNNFEVYRQASKSLWL